MSAPTAPEPAGPGPAAAGTDAAVEYLTPAANTFASLLAAPGTFPKVNLLPPEIEARRSLRRLQAVCAAALAVCLAAVGGLYYVEHSKIATAESNLEQAQNDTVRLQSEIRNLSYVTDTQQALAAAQAAVQASLGNEVQWSQYLHQLSLVIPDDVWLTQLNITQTTDGGSAASGSAASGSTATQQPSNASLPNSLGSVTLEGGALTWNAVRGWLDTLAGIKGFAGPYLTTSQLNDSGGNTYIQYTITVQVTSEALSHRYTQAGG